jgi:tetratricopeptide (TPR) repeat protein
VKFLNTSTSFDQQSLGSGNGVSWDAGILYRHNDVWSVGAAAHNLFDADVTYDNGSESRFYDMKLNAGIGYHPIPSAVIGMAFGDRLQIGGEYLYRELIAGRAGLQRDLDSDAENVYSFGLGLRYSPLQFDYTFTSYPHLSETHWVSLSAYFNFGYSLVSVDNVQLMGHSALFPSLWEVYRMTPFMSFELENKEERPLQCTWDVTIGDLLTASSEGEVILRPLERQTVYVRGDFSSAFYSNSSDDVVEGQVSVNYRTGRDAKSLSRSFQTVVYQKGAIDWNEDVNRVAGFINPRDLSVREVATTLLSEQSDITTESAVPRNVVSAMALFDGLSSNGIRYLADPSNPYSGIREKATGLDNIQFPVEVLNAGHGDCDDLTVLYCALLESIGIRTVVLDAPGHLLMMFDAGYPYAYRIALMCPEDYTIEFSGQAYIPVEVTAITDGFMIAWDRGTEQLRRWSAMDEISLVDVHRAWGTYSPVPAAVPLEETLSYAGAADSLLRHDLAVFSAQREEYVEREYEQPIARLAQDGSRLNRAAVTAMLAGDYTKAVSLFEAALEKEPQNVSARSNLACALSVAGQHARAKELFESLAPITSSDMAQNQLVALCLASENMPQEGRRDHWNGVLLRAQQYQEEGILALSISELRECPGESDSAPELAACFVQALGQEQEDLRTDKGSSQDEAEPISIMRLFQCL